MILTLEKADIRLAKMADLCALMDRNALSNHPNVKTLPKIEPPTRHLQWTHSEPLCRELVPWQILPLRETMKPLEGRAAAAHVGSCVFLCSLFLVGCGHKHF
jgi:hypothetical protein